MYGSMVALLQTAVDRRLQTLQTSLQVSQLISSSIRSSRPVSLVPVGYLVPIPGDGRDYASLGCEIYINSHLIS